MLLPVSTKFIAVLELDDAIILVIVTLRS
jgi:hypothetical protein